MGIRQSTPGEGGRKARVHFTYVSTDPKLPWDAYVAGPAMWYECHTYGKSQPCLDVVTDGELTCPRCGEDKPTELIGYVPLYRCADHKPVVCIVHEYTSEIVNKLTLHQKVKVSRGRAESDGVVVNPSLDPLPKFVTTLAERRVQAQPIESLLRMWRYPELIQWQNETEGTEYPVRITPPRQTAVPKGKGKGAPVPAPAPAGDMGETALEAMERIRIRNEEFIRQAKAGNPPT